MPLPILPPERVRAEALKQKKKAERLARAAAKKLAHDAYVHALSRARTPFLARLHDALVKNEGLTADLAPWQPVATAVHGLLADEQRAVVEFVVDVEARAAGLALVPLADDRLLGEAIVQLGRVQELFVRPLSTFMPRTRSRHATWDALVGHLCFRYASPPLLEACFLEHNLGIDGRRVAPRIGDGLSWRNTNLPITMTKKAAHALSTSKARFSSLTAAVRWAQATSLGVSPAKWAALSSAVPSLTSNKEDVVIAFYDFVARCAVDDLAFVAQEVARVDDLAFKGRTPATLLRWARAQKRERELRDAGRFDVGPLPRCVVDGGRYVLHREVESGLAPRIFTVEQIVDGEALVAEGIAMKHCVGTYATTAKSGETALFTMTVGHDGATPRRCVTIELNPKAREVRQVRGKANRRPDVDERGIVLAWAAERGLSVGRCA